MRDHTAAMLTSALFVGAALVTFAVPAQAATTSELIAQCATALEDRGIASSDDYRVKFISASGNSARTLTLKLLPKENGAETKVATCKVRRGEITELSLDA